MENKRQELGIMGPPPAMADSRNSRADAPPQPASTPSSSGRAAAPPKRIINLDFKKLKEAGLDRKLAEALVKQRAHTPSGSSSSSVATQSASATATTTMTAAAVAVSAASASKSLQSQQQQFHQPALPQTAVKRIKISESLEKAAPIQTPPLASTSSSLERSMHVKAILKNRILNKSMNSSTQNQKQNPLPAPKTPATATQGSVPRSGGSSNAAPTATTIDPIFSIPKADLTVRPKHPPLLLNLVNQLPKHRTMCVTTDDIQLRHQQELLQQKAFERHPPPQQKQQQYQQPTPHTSMQKSSQDASHISIQTPLQNQPEAPHISMQKYSQKLHNISLQNPSQAPLPSPSPEAPIEKLQKSPSPPPLIVLENKVLAPNEKIDLSNLGLPSSTTIVATILKTKSQPGAQPIMKGGKFIMNASKFKVPRQKLAEMAQEIRNQVKQVKQNTQTETEAPPERDSSDASIKAANTIPTEVDPKQQPGLTPSTDEAKDLIKLKTNKLPILTPSEFNETGKPVSATYALAASLDQEDETTESGLIYTAVNSAETENPKVMTETSFLDLPRHISTDSKPKQLNVAPDPEQEHLPAAEKPKNTFTSKKEIPESAMTTEAHESSSPVQSAVDFIAQLTAEQPLDESSFLDLSPEEQRLNALFGGAGGCSITGLSPENTEKEKGLPEDGGSVTVTTSSSKELPSVEEKRPAEEELPIGKIMKMDDMDILHATLDVSSDSTNILRISPNAIKLRSSVDKSLTELPPVTNTDVAILTTHAETLTDATLSESQKGENPQEPDISLSHVAEETSKGLLKTQLEPVPDSEPAKEVTPPAKRFPQRSKKAKINLVQRNKRPSIQNKPMEAKKTKLDNVEASDSKATTEIMDHSLLKEDHLSAGVKGIEVPVDEEQGVRKFREVDEQQGVSQSKEDKKQGVSKSEDDVKQQEVKEELDKQQEAIQFTEDESKEVSSTADAQNASKSAIQRDLSQLYHPPKMPKLKTSNNNINQEAPEHSKPVAATSVSLIDILSQEQPPPQGDAKLPFRKELPADGNTPESTGIQNLITHLTAEKVTLQTKEKKLSSTPPGSEESTTGMSRKKRVKTRPVLSKRNSAKKPDEKSLEFLHPSPSANVGGGRIPTSSTSDDDGTVFLGFNNKEEKRSKTPVRNKRVRQMRINETDISDDATPDYDETEEEQQRLVDGDFPNRSKNHVSDSDSSECPIYLEENPVNEGTSLDKSSESIEAASSKHVHWEDLIGNSKESILDAAIEPGNKQLEALNEPKDVTIDDQKSSRSKKQLSKPSPKKELNTKDMEINSDEPSTSKGILKTNKTKLKSKAGSQECITSKDSVKGSEKLSLLENTVEKVDKSNENNEELKAIEESVTFEKSKGKRTSRSSNVGNDNQAEASLKKETKPEQKEDEHEILEEPQKVVGTNKKRQSRALSVSKPAIDKEKEEQSIESTNVRGKRSSRQKTNSDPTIPAITEPAVNSIPSESIEAIKTRGSRKSRSTTPKESIPAKPVIKSAKNKTDTGGPEEVKDPEEVKAAEEPSHSRNTVISKRQSRGRKSTVAPPPAARDELKLDEEIKNANSENPQEVRAAEEPDNKRMSRGKSARSTDSAVGKIISTQQAAENPNLTNEQINVPSPTNVDATDEDDKPSTSNNSKRKRQSRNTQQKVRKIVAADETEQSASIADSQPEETHTRRSSSRVSSVSKDTADAPAPEDDVIPQTFPKRGKKSSAATQPQTHSDTLAAGEEDDSEAAAPSKSNRKRKRDATADTEQTGASKKPKTALKQDPGVSQAFNLRLLLIRNRDQLLSDEVLTEEGKGQGPLQCGLCLARSTKKDWQAHLANHYGVGWLVGETPTITRASVLRLMKKYIDESGKKITCRLCQRQLGSHIGMIVHLEGCGNKQRVECDLCKKSYTKLSFPMHRQACSSQKKKKEETGSSFNLRLLLIRTREQLETEEVLTVEGTGKGPLQCGLCLARCSKVNWQSHLEEHYGVGWLVGETPTNITRNWVMLKMKACLDQSKKKLACRLCDHQLGSALGMMLHLETCGNKERVECEICHKSYSILTLPGHFRVCSRRQLSEASMATDEQQVAEDAGEMVLSNAGRAKRKSTIKAETKLKKIGEHTSEKNEFNGSDSSDYDMAKDKESSDEYDSEGVDSNEDSITAEQDGSDCEKSRHSKKQTSKRRPGNGGERATKPLFLREETQRSSSTHKWKEFLQINYSDSPLYCNLVPGYSTLSLEDAHSLLPSKEETSVRYAYGKATQDSDWQRLAPLEGFNKEGEYVGYLGGPVRQLAWVPMPSTSTDQYLLCSLRSRMKSFARHSKLKPEDGLLMLLKCTEGPSNDETWTVRPELHYGIRVPNGPAHSFAFLPSGGYDQATNRLGLLAVAHATSDVHIYALPLEVKHKENAGENVVIQLDAVITLSLDVDQPPAEDQCTKICWSEASGHSFLATGYASGRIAFWDIGDTGSINCFRQNNDQAYTFVPTNSLYLGERNIQFMELHYDMNGIRWLAVGTAVRKFVVYDIMNWSQPTILMQSTWNNIYLATFTWSPVSEAIVLSSTHYNSRTIWLNPAGIEFDSRTLDSVLTASRSMHANCQQNYMVLVTDIGDLVFLDPKAITRGAYLAKTMINYRAVSTTELQHLGTGKPNPTDVISPDEFHRDYGVQINPLVETPPQSARKCPYLSEKRRPKNPHSLALTRNNCVRCNWNSSAHSWVAMGAEHGLLRILNFKRNDFF